MGALGYTYDGSRAKILKICLESGCNVDKTFLTFINQHGATKPHLNCVLWSLRKVIMEFLSGLSWSFTINLNSIGFVFPWTLEFYWMLIVPELAVMSYQPSTCPTYPLSHLRELWAGPVNPFETVAMFTSTELVQCSLTMTIRHLLWLPRMPDMDICVGNTWYGFHLLDFTCVSYFFFSLWILYCDFFGYLEFF